MKGEAISERLGEYFRAGGSEERETKGGGIRLTMDLYYKPPRSSWWRVGSFNRSEMCLPMSMFVWFSCWNSTRVSHCPPAGEKNSSYIHRTIGRLIRGIGTLGDSHVNGDAFVCSGLTQTPTAMPSTTALTASTAATRTPPTPPASARSPSSGTSKQCLRAAA